jgi:putative ABC transport system permease protein
VITVALRGLLSRKLRAVLTAIAIILGISMVSGTYVLTDTINNSFTKIFQQANRHLDAVITTRTVASSDTGRVPPPLPASLLSIVRATSGVADAEGEIGDTAQLYDLKGNALTTTGGAPSLLLSVPSARFRSSTLVRGHWPHGRQLAVDKGFFTAHHLHIGQVVRLAATIPAERFTIVGDIKFGNVSSLGGAVLLEVDLATAQHLTNKQGHFDQISVIGESGISQTALVTRLKPRIPAALRPTVDVKTAAQNAEDQTAQIGNALNFLTIALLAFAGIAIFVGAFIIFNTFSITVAQRTREFGLLRTLGATRRQVMISVVLEALLIGFLASLVGLLAGFGIAQGLNAVFKAVGADLPSAGLVVQTRTIVVSLLVGTIITVVSGLWPAFRATRVPPIAALREGAHLPRGRFARYTPYVAVGLIVLGVLILARGVLGSFGSTGSRLTTIGFGAVILFLGAAMISPQLVRPIAAVVGWPIERLTTITGRLARENTVRNPSRTAVTAAALMIGLALVGFVTILAAELKTSTTDAINRELAGQVVVEASQGQIPEGVGRAIAHVPGVAVVSPVKSDASRVAGGGRRGRRGGRSGSTVTGVQPPTVGQVYHLEWTHGSDAALSSLGPRDALVADDFASSHNLHVGSSLVETSSVGTTATFTVRGIFKASQILDPVVIRYDTMRQVWKLHTDVIDLLNVTPGQKVDAVKTRLTRYLKTTFPAAQVQSQQDIKDQASKSVNQLLYLIYVLLAMSVLVSLFGIINTLILSIYERTREIGMLRAIGTTRSQIRWTVTWESVITAVIGAVLGLVLGIILAVLVTSGLKSEGIEYAIPVGSLLIWLVFAIIFGVAASIYPAVRAARLDILQAIAYE